MGLYEIIINKDNLDRAWDKVRGKRAVPGTDGVTSEEFQINRKDIVIQLEKRSK